MYFCNRFRKIIKNEVQINYYEDKKLPQNHGVTADAHGVRGRVCSN